MSRKRLNRYVHKRIETSSALLWMMEVRMEVSILCDHWIPEIVHWRLSRSRIPELQLRATMG